MLTAWDCFPLAADILYKTYDKQTVLPLGIASLWQWIVYIEPMTPNLYLLLWTYCPLTAGSL